MEYYDPSQVLDETSLAVINKNGYLRQLYCPFRVLCIMDISAIKENSWVYVDKVSAKGRSIFYHIGKIKYPHTHFHIYIAF
jgi:hypothetical protein